MVATSVYRSSVHGGAVRGRHGPTNGGGRCQEHARAGDWVIDRPFFVYLVTNTLNGKVYVGKTCQPHVRWAQHVRSAKRGDEYLLQRAIRKYGEEAFAFQILASYAVEQEALDGEQGWIAEFRSSEVARGYNMTMGGDGVIPTPETLERMRAAAQKR